MEKFGENDVSKDKSFESSYNLYVPESSKQTLKCFVGSQAAAIKRTMASGFIPLKPSCLNTIPLSGPFPASTARANHSEKVAVPAPCLSTTFEVLKWTILNAMRFVAWNGSERIQLDSTSSIGCSN